MKLVVQRVSEASVNIQGNLHAHIKAGLLVLLGIHQDDVPLTATKMAQKLVALRIFENEQGKMDYSIKDVDGDILVVSQFTLYANTQKGNRPSFIEAARPEIAIPLYEYFCRELAQFLGKPIQTGVFGANMQVSLVNDGPVTVVLDSSIIL